MKNKIITVDFDGTICSHRFPRIGLEAPGAFRWLKRFKELGATVILLTMRSDHRFNGSPPFLTEAVEFCKQHGFEFDYVNEPTPGQRKWTTSPKFYSQIHIDDTNACCPLREAVDCNNLVVDWEVVGPWVEAQLVERSENNPIVAPGPRDGDPK